MNNPEIIKDIVEAAERLRAFDEWDDSGLKAFRRVEGSIRLFSTIRGNSCMLPLSCVNALVIVLNGDISITQKVRATLEGQLKDLLLKGREELGELIKLPEGINPAPANEETKP